MGKVKGKIPSLEDWLAPWEQDPEGNAIPEDEQEIDPPRLKRYLHGLLVDKEKSGEMIAAFEEDERTRKEAEQAKEREGETEVQRLQRENEALRNKQTEKVFDPAEAALDIIAENYKHLTVSQARRIARRAAGKDADDVEKDVLDMLETFGLDQAPTEETEERTTPLRGQPRGRGGRAAGDPKQESEPSSIENVDIDKEFARTY